MCVLQDSEIRRLVDTLFPDGIHLDQIRENGVDLTLDSEYAVLRRSNVTVFVNGEVDVDIDQYYEFRKGDPTTGDYIRLEPGKRYLLVTRERVRMPSNVVGLVNLKSTLARLGLIVPPTVVDAGFEGQIVIEVLGSSFPIVLKPGTPFIHLVLLRTCGEVESPYGVSGHYQGQRGVRTPRLPLRVYDKPSSRKDNGRT